VKINNPDNMNFFLTDIPERTQKPRENGLTMMMDKGLSINDTKNFIDMCGSHTDIIKLGFGTSAIFPHIETKIPNEDILWEAPKKPKQVWFIKLLGAILKLGNIAWNEVIPLKILKIGLREDAFFNYISEKKKWSNTI